MAYKLEALPARRPGQRGFETAVAEDFHRVRVQVVLEGLAFLDVIRIGHGQQTIVQTHLGAHRVRRRHPLDRRAVLALGARGLTQRIRVIGAAQLDHLAAGRVFDNLVTFDEVGVA